MSRWAGREPCKDCGDPKPPGAGLRYCEPCGERRKSVYEQAQARRRRIYAERKRRVKGQRKRPSADAPPGHKWCPMCQEYRSVKDFGKNKSIKKDGLASYCRPCYSVFLHERGIFQRFGLTVAEYDQLFDAQEGKCAICYSRPRTRRLAIDHDHVTGAIRGLLCTRCNHKILGAAKEDPVILRRAADYLDSPPARDAGLFAEPQTKNLSAKKRRGRDG